jgi:hypothetical protein
VAAASQWRGVKAGGTPLDSVGHVLGHVASVVTCGRAPAGWRARAGGWSAAVTVCWSAWEFSGLAGSGCAPLATGTRGPHGAGNHAFPRVGTARESHRRRITPSQSGYSKRWARGGCVAEGSAREPAALAGVERHTPSIPPVAVQRTYVRAMTRPAAMVEAAAANWRTGDGLLASARSSTCRRASPASKGSTGLSVRGVAAR